MLKEILKLIKELTGQGYASAAQKKSLADKVATLKSEDQAALAEDVDTVNDLPEGDATDEGNEELEEGVKSLFKRHALNIEKSLKTEIKSYMEEQHELIAKKAGVYNPDISEKRKSLSENIRSMAKGLLNSNETLLKEMTSDATGSPYAGYTVDSELSAEIRHLITEYGVARREMMAIQLTKGSYKANDLATDITVYWVDEGAAIASSQAVLGQESLTLKKLGVIVSMTAELLEDTEIDFVSFLASRVAEGFAQAEDEAFFKGDGTSSFGSFTGLLEATDVNEVTMASGLTGFADVTAEHFLNMMDATPAGALANGKFYMNRTILSIVRKLREDAVSAADGAGAFIYQSPSQQGPATLWGRPVVLVEAMPTASDTAVDTSFALFGDLRKACIFGYNQAIKMSRFNAGVIRNVADDADINLITTDREAVRWTERVGYIRIIPTAVTRLTTAAS